MSKAEEQICQNTKKIKSFGILKAANRMKKNLKSKKTNRSSIVKAEVTAKSKTIKSDISH